MTQQKPPYLITAANQSLWGQSGGQLEYVGQEIFHRQREDGKWEAMIRLKFTDHDFNWDPSEECFKMLEPGVHYYIEVPLRQ